MSAPHTRSALSVITLALLGSVYMHGGSATAQTVWDRQDQLEMMGRLQAQGLVRPAYSSRTKAQTQAEQIVQTAIRQGVECAEDAAALPRTSGPERASQSKQAVATVRAEQVASVDPRSSARDQPKRNR